MKLFVSLMLSCGLCSAIIYTDSCTRCQNENSCHAPGCFCCRDEFNLPFPKKDIPQIVYFTFDDALTDAASKFYRRLFNETRMNPNNCPISMTLFISHQDTIYRNVNDFYKRGMEIASHSVTHNQMNKNNFMQEAKIQKENLAKLGGVPKNEIVGWRSPFLKPIGDMQPEKLKELGYLYDATLTFSKRKLSDKVPSPFTLDFGWPYDCKVKPCPKRYHPGFWEVPVVSLLDYKHMYDCVYVDGCNNPPPNEEYAYQFLMDNFNSYYTSSRLPFGINMHSSWFYINDRLNAMDRFIKTLLKMDDVYIVSVDKMVRWLQNPTPLSKLNSFEPWKCDMVKAHHKAVSERRQRPVSMHNIVHVRNNNYIKHGMSRDEIQRLHIQTRLRQLNAMRRQIELKRQKRLFLLQQLKNQQNMQGRSKNTVFSSRNNLIHRQSPRKVQQPKKSISNAHQNIAAPKPNPFQSLESRISPNIINKEFDRQKYIQIKKSRQGPYYDYGQNVPFWQRSQLGSRRLPEAALQQDSAWWNKPVPRVQRPQQVTNAPLTTPTTAPKTTKEAPTEMKPPPPPKVITTETKTTQVQDNRVQDLKKTEQEQLEQQKLELKRNEQKAFSEQNESKKQQHESKLTKTRFFSGKKNSWKEFVQFLTKDLNN